MKKPSLVHSFRVAFRGIFYVLRRERNFQIHSLALVVNGGLIYYFPMRLVEVGIILFCCGLVMALELMNTSIEAICDYIQPNFDAKIGVIKDMSAGAVLLATLFSIVIGVLIYLPYINDVF